MAQKTTDKTKFTTDVNNGMTKAKLAEKYELPANIVSKFVRELGLKLKRENKPKYTLVDTEETSN